MIIAIHHHQVVGLVRDLPEPAQIAGHHVQRHIGAYRDHIRIHQAAGGILRVSQDIREALPVLRVHGLQDGAGHLIRQVLQYIGDIISRQRPGGVGHISGAHLFQHIGAHRVLHLRQHRAFPCRVEQGPHAAAFPGRQALDKVGHLGGMQALDKPPGRRDILGIQGGVQ